MVIPWLCLIRVTKKELDLADSSADTLEIGLQARDRRCVVRNEGNQLHSSSWVCCRPAFFGLHTKINHVPKSFSMVHSPIE